jgi:type IV secretory pathway VirB3-like protein
MRWTGYVAHTWEVINAFEVLIGKTRREETIKGDRDIDRVQASVNMVQEHFLVHFVHDFLTSVLFCNFVLVFSVILLDDTMLFNIFLLWNKMQTCNFV